MAVGRTRLPLRKVAREVHCFEIMLKLSEKGRCHVKHWEESGVWTT